MSEKENGISNIEQQFRMLFEQNYNIISIISPTGEILSMNKKGLGVFGYSEQELKNQSFGNYTVKEEDKEHSNFVIQQLNNKKEVKPYPKKFKTKTGEVIDFEVSVSGIYDEDDKLKQIVTILHDITERVKFQQVLIEQKEKAQESDRLKSSFLMNMSHEIRTPLNAILGFSTILKSTLKTQDQLSFLSYIEQGGNRLLDTVTDILDASLLQQNELVIVDETFDLMTVLEQVFKKCQKHYNNINKDVTFNFVNKCSYKEFLLNTDKSRFEEVIRKLVDNAFKFGNNSAVSLICSNTDEQIIISVEDNGIGIEDDRQSFIFNFFRQGDESSTRAYEGLGLGLPISKGILELMGFNLDVESEVNKGTKASVIIPIERPEENVLLEEKENAITHSKLSSLAILIVEDDFHSCILLKNILEPYNSNLCTAKTGAECRKLLEEHEFDVVLLDLKLPDMLGLELIPDIKTSNNNCVIIGQSAFTTQESINNAKAKGADYYLTKPIESDKLIGLLSEITED